MDALNWYPYNFQAVTHSNFDMNFTVFYDARDLLNGNTIEYLLIWTSCMYNVHCTSRCMFLWKYTMNTYDKYARNMQVYVIECSFILVKFTETKKTQGGHKIWACYCTFNWNFKTIVELSKIYFTKFFQITRCEVNPR